MGSRVNDVACRRHGLHEGVARSAGSERKAVCRGHAVFVGGDVGDDVTRLVRERAVVADDVGRGHDVKLRPGEGDTRPQVGLANGRGAHGKRVLGLGLCPDDGRLLVLPANRELVRSLVQDKALRCEGLHKGVACLARAQGQPLDRGLALLVGGHVGHDLACHGLDGPVRGDDVLLRHHFELGSRQWRPALRRLGQLG